MRIVTNNPLVQEKLTTAELMFIQGGYAEILESVKKEIIDNHAVLLSHPLSSSLKPNETPYKSIMITSTPSEWIDMESLEYIESAIQVYETFYRNKPLRNWSDKILADFAVVDLDIVQNTLERIGGMP